MATTRHIGRLSEFVKTDVRKIWTTAANHSFAVTDTRIGSWKPPSSPKEAESRLGLLRRDYARHVKSIRKGYIHEMEVSRAEKARKDEAEREAVRAFNEARRAEKEKERLHRANQRLLADRHFRQTLLKERAEKLAYWKKKVEQVEEKKKKAEEGVRNRSSMWVDEADLERKLLEAIVGHAHFGFFSSVKKPI